MTIRARNKEDKLARREAILIIASHTLEGRRLGEITMSEIAARCGLAKGTLYLYFPTKEELFLAAVEMELVAWLDVMGAELTRRAPLDPRTFARVVVSTLSDRRMLTDLLPLMRVLLRHDDARGVEDSVSARLEAVAAILEDVLPLRRGGGLRALLRAHAVVAGLQHIGLAPRAATGPSARFGIEAEHELLDSVTAIVDGMVQPQD
jgi:AcrR family transcriptional regulator